MEFSVSLDYLRKIFPEIIEEDVKLAKTINGISFIFGNTTSFFMEDVIYSLISSNYSIEDFKKYSISTKFYNTNDFIFQLPIFKNEQENYDMKMKQENAKNEIAESMYNCRKCKRPAISEQRQTRSSDEGVTVFVHCESCNITYTA